MPSDDSIRQKIQYQRRKRKFSELKLLAEIVLGDIKTIDGASFLLTNITEPKRLIIFGTNKNLEMLMQSDEVMMDETFKIVPSINGFL